MMAHGKNQKDSITENNVSPSLPEFLSINMKGKAVREFLDQNNYPYCDDIQINLSPGSFEAGGQYGIEISSVNNLEILKYLVELAEENNIRIDRCDECRGIFRLPDKEITEMVKFCASNKIGLLMSTGPRAIYDTGAFIKSESGKRQGYRLRGIENVVSAMDDIHRAIDLGVRGFLIYDEGLLFLIARMKEAGELPKNCIFKLSVHVGCSNPMSAVLYEQLGADSINLVPDLDLSMLSAIRRSVKCPLDLFTDTANEAGGFIRTYDAPSFIKIAAPVYLKCGPISQPKQNHLPSQEELRERIKQTRCVVEHVNRYYPEALPVSNQEKTLAIPGD
jgi:hypothetical protein